MTDDSADWITTIAYHNDVNNGYIRIWFVQAPNEYLFSKYLVTLEMILTGEDTREEHRNKTEELKISKVSTFFSKSKMVLEIINKYKYDCRLLKV